MNDEIIGLLVVIGLIASSLVLGESIFDLLYDNIPTFRAYVDYRLSLLPEWEDDE